MARQAYRAIPFRHPEPVEASSGRTCPFAGHMTDPGQSPDYLFLGLPL